MNLQKSENLAEVAISYKTNVKPNDRLKISTAEDAYQILKNIYNDETVEHHEEFVILFLNRAMHVLGWAKTSVGGINAAIVDIRIVFQNALLTNSVGLIISHNHPSGITKPSEEDKKLTKKIVEGGKLLDIEVKDHVIFARNSYYSFAEEAEI